LPQIPSIITRNTTNFVVQMAKVKRVLWTDIFFGTYIYHDPKNNHKNIIVLDLPDRANPFPGYYLYIFYNKRNFNINIYIYIYIYFLNNDYIFLLVIKYWKND
jgi:hypothetical protein